MSADARILVTPNGPDYPWPWTATLQMLDRAGWYGVDTADGDTRGEAVMELRGQSNKARRAEVLR